MAEARPATADALCLCRLPVRRNLRDETDTVLLGRSSLEVLGDENSVPTETPFSTHTGRKYCIESDDYEYNFTAVWDSYLGCLLVAVGGSSDLLRVCTSGRVAPLLHSATFLRQQRVQHTSDARHRLISAGPAEAAVAGGAAAPDSPETDEAVSFTCVATSGSGSVWVVVNGSDLFHLDVAKCRGHSITHGGSHAAAADAPAAAAADAAQAPACQRLCAFSEPVTALAYDPHHLCLLVATGTELYAVPALAGADASATSLPPAIAAAPGSHRRSQRPHQPWAWGHCWDGEPRLLLGGVGDAEARRLGPQRDGGAEAATLAGVVGLAACGRRGEWLVLEQVMAQCSRRRGVAPRSCVRRLRLQLSADAFGGGGGDGGARAAAARIETLVTAEDAAWRSPLVLPGGVLAVLQDGGGGGGGGSAGGGLGGGSGGCEVVLMRLGLTPPPAPMTALAAAEAALTSADSSGGRPGEGEEGGGGGGECGGGSGPRVRSLAADLGALLLSCQPSPAVVLRGQEVLPGAGPGAGSGDDGSDGTADVWLVAAGGEVLAAHCGVLAARCDYFRPLLAAGSGFADASGGGGGSGSGVDGGAGGSGAGGGGMRRRRLLSMLEAQPDALMLVLRHLYTGQTDQLLPLPSHHQLAAPLPLPAHHQLLPLPAAPQSAEANPVFGAGASGQQQQERQQHLIDLAQQREAHGHRRRARRVAVRSAAGAAEVPGGAAVGSGCAIDAALPASFSPVAPETIGDGSDGDRHLELLWSVAALADQLLLPELSRAAGRALLRWADSGGALVSSAAARSAATAAAGMACASAAAATDGRGAGGGRGCREAVAGESGPAAATAAVETSGGSCLGPAADALLQRAEAQGFVELAEELWRRRRRAAPPPPPVQPHQTRAQTSARGQQPLPGQQARRWQRRDAWAPGGDGAEAGVGTMSGNVHSLVASGADLLRLWSGADVEGGGSWLGSQALQAAGLEGLIAVMSGGVGGEAAAAASLRGDWQLGLADGAAGQRCGAAEGPAGAGSEQEQRSAGSGGSCDDALGGLEELARVSGAELDSRRVGAEEAARVSVEAAGAAPLPSPGCVKRKPGEEARAASPSTKRQRGM